VIQSGPLPPPGRPLGHDRLDASLHFGGAKSGRHSLPDHRRDFGCRQASPVALQPAPLVRAQPAHLVTLQLRAFGHALPVYTG
jgi:hypothetical protein